MARSSTPLADVFLAVYPRRQANRVGVEAALARLIGEGVPLAELVAVARLLRADFAARGIDPMYVPSPEPWLGNAGWRFYASPPWGLPSAPLAETAAVVREMAA